MRALIALLLTVALAAQARDQRTASVGMRAFVEQIVIPGTQLEPAPSKFGAPVVVRVVKTWPHGEQLRYDLEWVGFEEGTFNLLDYLVRRDGSTKEGLEPITVEVTSVLPPGDLEPGDLEPKTSERLGGYSTLQVVVAVAWGIGLVLILFVGRRRKPRTAPPETPATLADRLRPLVERVQGGAASDAQKAELERLLVAFWRERLDLGDVKAVDAIVAIKRHEQAGALLRQVEAWLHMPNPPRDVDVQHLLAPYRSVTADRFPPEAG
ncbi:MAG TPA: hypothetical protein ENI87_13880 [bacterium]|nr:hypothetical protein [bacterium]